VPLAARDDPESVRGLLLTRIADPSLSLTIVEPGLPAPQLPIDPEVVAQVRAASQGFWPGLIVTPALNLGSSDSDFTRAAGIPTYGLCSIFYDLDDDRMHAADERISAAAFDEGVRYMAVLMLALSRQ
jgi:acetylornithine deacetylase/succinyl-diaminopimelate desuccinylase-like protein